MLKKCEGLLIASVLEPLAPFIANETVFKEKPIYCGILRNPDQFGVDFLLYNRFTGEAVGGALEFKTHSLHKADPKPVFYESNNNGTGHNEFTCNYMTQFNPLYFMFLDTVNMKVYFNYTEEKLRQMMDFDHPAPTSVVFNSQFKGWRMKLMDESEFDEVHPVPDYLVPHVRNAVSQAKYISKFFQK